jgi:hypothetical protein
MKTTRHEAKGRLEAIFKEKEQGFTISFNTFKEANHKKGYYVSLTNNKAHDRKALKSLLGRVKEQKRAFDSLKNLYLGGWHDFETDFYYLDLSLWLDNKRLALSIGQIFKQKAVYDIQNQRCIEVKA